MGAQGGPQGPPSGAPSGPPSQHIYMEVDPLYCGGEGGVTSSNSSQSSGYSTAPSDTTKGVLEGGFRAFTTTPTNPGKAGEVGGVKPQHREVGGCGGHCGRPWHPSGY